MRDPDQQAESLMLTVILVCLSVAIAAMVFCGGCGGYTQQRPDPNARRDRLTLAELERWEMWFQKPFWQCWAETGVLRWDDVDEATVQRDCLVSFEVDGCTYYEASGPVIALENTAVRTDEQLERLERHELTHWLAICSGVDPTGDPGHKATFWEGLL